MLHWVSCSYPENEAVCPYSLLYRVLWWSRRSTVPARLPLYTARPLCTIAITSRWGRQQLCLPLSLSEVRSCSIMSGGSSKAWNKAEIIFTPSGYILVLKQLLSLQEHGMSFLSGCLDGVKWVKMQSFAHIFTIELANTTQKMKTKTNLLANTYSSRHHQWTKDHLHLYKRKSNFTKKQFWL